MNYYNEFDPKAAAWLRELIKRKLIPDGEVDERSIADVRADELAGFLQCHFFAGIGGWSLALRLAGWPEDKPVWTGSCPCQSFSNAGKQKGAEDDRDLWPAFFDLIKACRPEYVFGEQVEAAIRHGWLDRVCANLEAEDYAVGACVLGAHSAGAPHQRQRLYWGASRLAQDSAILRCGGWNNGDSAGDDREIQAAGLGACCGVEYSPLLGSGKGQSHARGGSCGGGKEQRALIKCASGGVVSLAHADLPRRGECGRDEPILSECATTKLDSVYSLSPWDNFAIVNCTDGKIRRVPAESLLFGVADGVPEGVDGGGDRSPLDTPEKGFPLSKKLPAHNMLIKGYGNAINPWCGKVFLEWFFEQEK